MKLFLTSAGFDNRRLVGEFLALTDKTGESMTALFIPTALNTPEMKNAVPIFLEDLYCLGIKKENITEYNLEEPFKDDINNYDVILFTAGNPEFLMERINSTGFKEQMDTFLENGGIYIGISAGSDIAAKNLTDGLGYIDTVIECHCKEGDKPGPINLSERKTIYLSDEQALVMNGNDIRIKE